MKQSRIITSTIIIFVLIGISGCGYFSGGNWEDDTDNWGRAFHSKKPDDVIVLHSRYWQSSHWTLEFEYFFEIASNQQLSEQLFTQNKLIRLEGQDAVLAKGNYLGDCQEWFAPKTID